MPSCKRCIEKGASGRHSLLHKGPILWRRLFKGRRGQFFPLEEGRFSSSYALLLLPLSLSRSGQTLLADERLIPSYISSRLLLPLPPLPRLPSSKELRSGARRSEEAEKGKKASRAGRRSEARPTGPKGTNLLRSRATDIPFFRPHASASSAKEALT